LTLRIQEKLRLQEPAGRKAVDFDPNKTFARAPEIAKAHYEAATAAALYQARHGPNLLDDALEIAIMEKA
ncbi:hypothetical protein IL306_006139, partial [Fusarium sp. DS 682]